MQPAGVNQKKQSQKERQQNPRGKTSVGHRIVNLIAETSVHRRIFWVINNAVHPEDLPAAKRKIPRVEVSGFELGVPVRDDHGLEFIDTKVKEQRKQAIAAQLKFASDILKFRDENHCFLAIDGKEVRWYEPLFVLITCPCLIIKWH